MTATPKTPAPDPALLRLQEQAEREEGDAMTQATMSYLQRRVVQLHMEAAHRDEVIAELTASKGVLEDRLNDLLSDDGAPQAEPEGK